jgi:vacuolar-type H+-ATPase subunit I/STV1
VKAEPHSHDVHLDDEPIDFGLSERDRKALGRDGAFEGLTLAQVRARIHELQTPLVEDRLEQLRAARLVGLYWIAALKQAAQMRDNLSARKFARYRLGIRYETARDCARVAVGWPDVLAAHRWITRKETREAGWIARAETGATYAKEILKLYRDFKLDLSPTDREDEAETQREQKAAIKRAAQEQSNADHETRDEGRRYADEEAVAQAGADRDRIKEDFDTLWQNSAKEVQAARRRAALWKQEAHRLRAALLTTKGFLPRRRP